MTPAILYKETRKNFPNPIASSERHNTGNMSLTYCVLGALSKQILGGGSCIYGEFPCHEEAQKFLILSANPQCKNPKRLARLIVQLNDTHRIPRAWQALKLSLTGSSK